jgi:hypothetical protein
MSLLWVDGFDAYGTTLAAAPSPTGILARNYLFGGTSASEANTRVVAGRVDARALDIGLFNLNIRKLGLDTTDDTLIFGCAVKIKGPSINGGVSLFSMDDDSTAGVHIRTNSNGTLYLYAGTTTVATTTFALVVGTWYYLELKITCTSATNYDYELRIGQTTLLTGSDTHKAGTHAYLNGVTIWGNNYNTGIVIDDFYISNGAGSYNTDFLGNIYIQLVYPNSDDGPNQFTGSNGASHYTLISETSSDDTTYVEDDVAGHEECFGYEDVTAIGAIRGVAIYTEARDTDTESANFRNKCVSTVNTATGDLVLSGCSDYTTKATMFEVDPDTGALWTAAGFNGACFGFIIE